jgi:hypothetical protein
VRSRRLNLLHAWHLSNAKHSDTTSVCPVLSRHHRDVDDLEDIGQLETYVLASQAVLLFLSKGCKAVALELRMPA